MIMVFHEAIMTKPDGTQIKAAVMPETPYDEVEARAKELGYTLTQYEARPPSEEELRQAEEAEAEYYASNAGQ